MHSEFIKTQIIRLCKQPRTFEFISLHLDGYDPVELLETLKKLELENTIIYINQLWCIKNKTSLPRLNISNDAQTNFFNEYIGFFGLFKKPHPLDFEWRNSTGTLNYLINKVQKTSEVNDKILFLGFPTLFATACINDIPQEVTLVEKNKPIIKGLSQLTLNKERFRIFEADIFTANPHQVGKFHSVVMDPPWYTPHFYQFMWLAAQCVELGGTVGISLPPINTRPNIAEERIDWFSFCQQQGLCLESLSSQKLHYAMPFFEFNAFRIAGVKNILPFWRKGDLAFFRKMGDAVIDRPKLTEHRDEWVEREFFDIRIRIKKEENNISEQQLKFTSVVKGDILPSVSTRDVRREQANIWTSGNRIYQVNNSSKFLLLLDEVIAGNVSMSEALEVEAFVKTIVDIESKEYSNYLDWLYHEMERQTD